MKLRLRRKPGTPFAFERWAHGDPKSAPLLELPLSVRTLNRLCSPRYWDKGRLPEILKEDGVRQPVVAGDLESLRPSHLLRLDGFGRTSLAEVEAWLAAQGMHLAPGLFPRRPGTRIQSSHAQETP